MNAMSDAKKQKAYRERQKVKAVGEEYFGGQLYVTIEAFREAVKLDGTVFFDELKGLGEESDTHKEERDEVYDAAFREAYEEERQEAVSLGEFNPEEDDDDHIREAAREAALEAVKEWDANVEDYDSTCVEYSLVDLVAAYRAACII